MRILKKIWKKWFSITKPIGNFQAIVLLSVFYLIALFIFGFIFKIFIDPLGINPKSSKNKKKSNFSRWEHAIENLSDSKKPF